MFVAGVLLVKGVRTVEKALLEALVKVCERSGMFATTVLTIVDENM